MQVFFMKSIKSWLIAGFIFTSVLGTLSHFFYGWSDENLLIGLISPVNESTWEHMKLVFFPVLLWSLLLPSRLSDESPSLRPALLSGGLLGTFAVPVIFYTYSGILGRNVTWIDILIFFISIAVIFFYTWKLKNSAKIYEKRTAIYFLTVLFLVLFFLFTFLPPAIGLFAEP